MADAEAWQLFCAAARGDFSEAELYQLSLTALSRLVSHYGITSPVDAARIEVAWRARQAAPPREPEPATPPQRGTGPSLSPPRPTPARSPQRGSGQQAAVGDRVAVRNSDADCWHAGVVVAASDGGAPWVRAPGVAGGGWSVRQWPQLMLLAPSPRVAVADRAAARATGRRGSRPSASPRSPHARSPGSPVAPPDAGAEPRAGSPPPPRAGRTSPVRARAGWPGGPGDPRPEPVRSDPSPRPERAAGPQRGGRGGAARRSNSTGVTRGRADEEDRPAWVHAGRSTPRGSRAGQRSHSVKRPGAGRRRAGAAAAAASIGVAAAAAALERAAAEAREEVDKLRRETEGLRLLHAKQTIRHAANTQDQDAADDDPPAEPDAGSQPAKLTIIRAVNLPRTGVRGGGDVFVDVVCGEWAEQTPATKATAHPVWKETLQVPPSGDGAGITIRVVAVSTDGEDSVLGEAELAFESTGECHEVLLGDDGAKLYVSLDVAAGRAVSPEQPDGVKRVALTVQRAEGLAAPLGGWPQGAAARVVVCSDGSTAQTPDAAAGGGGQARCTDWGSTLLLASREESDVTAFSFVVTCAAEVLGIAEVKIDPAMLGDRPVQLCLPLRPRPGHRADSTRERRNQGTLGTLHVSAEMATVPQEQADAQLAEEAEQLRLERDALMQCLRSGGGDAAGPTHAELVVVRAEGLAKGDLIGKNDPYVELQTGGATHRTSVADGAGANPEWSEGFQVALDGSGGLRVKFSVREHDPVGDHEWLGVGELSLTREDVACGDLHEIALQPRPGNSGDASRQKKNRGSLGKLYVSVVAAGQADERAASPQTDQSQSPQRGEEDSESLRLTILRAEQLAKTELIGSNDVYVCVLAGGEEIHRTEVRNNADAPEWNEEVELPAGMLADGVALVFRVMDKDDISADDEIGTGEFSLQPHEIESGDYCCPLKAPAKKKPKHRGLLHVRLDHRDPEQEKDAEISRLREEKEQLHQQLRDREGRRASGEPGIGRQQSAASTRVSESSPQRRARAESSASQTPVVTRTVSAHPQRKGSSVSRPDAVTDAGTMSRTPSAAQPRQAAARDAGTDAGDGMSRTPSAAQPRQAAGTDAGDGMSRTPSAAQPRQRGASTVSRARGESVVSRQESARRTVSQSSRPGDDVASTMAGRMRFRLVVVRAEGLAKGEVFGKNDPYVRGSIAGRSFKTTVKEGGGDCPVWSEVFSGQTDDDGAFSATFEVMEHDAIGDHECLGVAELVGNAGLLRAGGQQRLDLLPREHNQADANRMKKNGGSLGVLVISLECADGRGPLMAAATDAGRDQRQPPGSRSGEVRSRGGGARVEVLIVSAQSLLVSDYAKGALVAQVQCGSTRFATPERSVTRSPVWLEDSDPFVLDTDSECELKFSVVEVLSGQVIGSTSAQVSVQDLDDPFTELSLVLLDGGQGAGVLVVRVSRGDQPSMVSLDETERTRPAGEDVDPAIDVNVVRTRDLPTSGARALEPFVVLELGSHKFVTTARPAGSFPMWCEHFTCPVVPGEQVDGFAWVMDRSEEPAVCVGEGEVILSEEDIKNLLAHHQSSDVTIPLSVRSPQTGGAPTLCLRLRSAAAPSSQAPSRKSSVAGADSATHQKRSRQHTEPQVL